MKNISPRGWRTSNAKVLAGRRRRWSSMGCWKAQTRGLLHSAAVWGLMPDDLGVLLTHRTSTPTITRQRMSVGLMQLTFSGSRILEGWNRSSSMSWTTSCLSPGRTPPRNPDPTPINSTIHSTAPLLPRFSARAHSSTSSQRPDVPHSSPHRRG